MLFALGIVANWYLLSRPVNVYDEGIILTGALRVLRGEIPYADFWSMYPPGPFYVVAGLFGIFGDSVNTERIYDVIIRSLLPLCWWWAARSIGGSRWSAGFAWSLSLLWLGQFSFSGYPIYAALALFIASACLFLRYLLSENQRNLWVCGILAAIGCVFRHDFGAFFMACLLVTFVIHVMCEKKPVEPAQLTQRSWFTASRTLTYGLASILIPLAVVFALMASPTTIIDQLVVTPARVMPAYRWLPYPSFQFNTHSTIPFYAYPLLSALGFCGAIVLIITKSAPVGARYGLLLTSSFGLALMNQARVRSDLVHLLPALLVSIVAGSSLALVLWNLPKRLSGKFLCRGISLILLATVITPAIPLMASKYTSLTTSSFSLRQYEGKSGWAPISGDLRQTIRYIHDHSQPTDAIYIGVTNHDQFTVNHVALYYLSDRPSATRYHELHPGVTTLASVQNEIITELTAQDVKLVILTASYGREPNQTAVDEGIDLLDTYIREHFQRTIRIGGYHIWTRKS